MMTGVTAFIAYLGAAVVLGVLCLVIGAVCADRFRATFLRPSGMHASLPGEAGTSARRTPPAVETPAAAGGAPGTEGTWSSPQEPGDVPAPRRADTEPINLVDPRVRDKRQRAHADTMHAMSARYLPAPPIRGQRPAARHSAPGHAATQPRSTPPVLSGDRLAAEREAAQAAGQRAGAAWQQKSPELLRQLHDGLLAWRVTS